MNELFQILKDVLTSRRAGLLIGLQAGLIFIVCLIYVFHYQAISSQTPDEAGTNFDLEKAHVVLSSTELKADRPLTCYQGTVTHLNLQVLNYSPYNIISGLDPNSAHRINLGHRLFHPDSDQLILEGPRYQFKTPVRHAVNENSPTKRDVFLIIKCPDQPGNYRLSVEIVQEGRAWQSDVHKPENFIHKHPLKSLSLSDQSSWSTSYRHFPKDKMPETGRANSDETQAIYSSFKMAKRLLDVTTVSLQRDPFPIYISEAGSQYPMVWSRDMNTIQRAYDLMSISPTPQSHWAELFFDKQYGDSGEIPDWIALTMPWDGQWFDKNDVQSDQELWLIDSVLSALNQGTLSSEWLLRKTNKTFHKDSLQKAMNWVLKNRFNQNDGCIWNAHTVDWGDVAMYGADSKTSTKRSHNSSKVCGLFLQSLFLKVSQQYLHLNQSVKGILSDELKSKIMQAQQSVRRFLISKLWISEKGYFRMHVHLGHKNNFPPAIQNDEEKFALGGHVLAFEAGLLSKGVLKRIAQHILDLKRDYKASTIGVVLYPPYPSSTFENPIMKQFEYQNGGQWDWFGARATLLIEAAFPGQGVKALHEIALKTVKNATFYEWDHPDGSPGAGPHFRAGAAAYITAYHGLFKKETFAKSLPGENQITLKVF